MKRGEIRLFGLDPTQGHEQQGRSPVLIVSAEAFNRVTKLPVVLPITSGGNFARAAGFAVSLQGSGTKTTGIVRCDQPRALDLGRRGGKKQESVSDTIRVGYLFVIPIGSSPPRGVASYVLNHKQKDFNISGSLQ